MIAFLPQHKDPEVDIFQQGEVTKPIALESSFFYQEKNIHRIEALVPQTYLSLIRDFSDIFLVFASFAIFYCVMGCAVALGARCRWVPLAPVSQTMLRLIRQRSRPGHVVTVLFPLYTVSLLEHSS